MVTEEWVTIIEVTYNLQVFYIKGGVGALPALLKELTPLGSTSLFSSGRRYINQNRL
jgi:hypothetical protein